MILNLDVNKHFEKYVNKLKEEYGEELTKLNGISDEQLDSNRTYDKYTTSDVVSDVSIDGSANVSRKDVAAILGDVPKPERKLSSYSRIYTQMSKDWGLDDAKNWFEKEWKGYLYLHDANSAAFVHYCFAYDLKDLAEKGLYFIAGPNVVAPPRHLETFIDFVKEYINFASNRSSGAVGLPNLIPYMYYFWKKDLEVHYFSEYYSPEYWAKQHIQRFVYAVNQPYTRDGIQSAFTNTSIFDSGYLTALFGGATFPDGSFMIDDIDGIMQFQKWYLEETAEIKHHRMYTYPVNSISILKDGKGGFEDEEFAMYAIRHNMQWEDSNLFVDDSVTSLSNCCRLKSNIDDIGYFNSIGGSALKVGSLKVSTINLARLAYESVTEEEYLYNLEQMVTLDCKALHSVRNVIKNNVANGWLPNFTYGLVDFEHLYNTVGFIGMYETLKSFGYTYTDDLENVYISEKGAAFGKKIFDTITRVSKQFEKDYNLDYHINKEQIPGETAASVLMDKDIIFHGDKVVTDLPLYGNQFLPLGIKATMNERIRVAALFDSYCNGGSILHINIESPFTTFEQAWDMFKYVVDAGVTYFAFNTRIKACKNGHAFYDNICPICGEKVATEYTRIVGFYVPVSSFGKKRKAEYKLRQWM